MPPADGSWLRFAPWALVVIAVLWGLWELRPELTAVPYLDDSSLHEQMVRSAASRINQGHLPLTSWWPYLGLGLAAVPALPEPALDDLGRLRHVHRPRHGVPLVDVPVARTVAARRLLVGAAVRARPLDGGRGGGCLAAARLDAGDRVRGHRLHLAGLRRVDPAVGVVDAAPGVGLQLSGARRAALDPPIGAAGRLLHHGDGRPPLRDGLPRLRAARRVALPRPLRPVAPAGADGARRRRRGVGVGVGDRAAARPVPLGGA